MSGQVSVPTAQLTAPVLPKASSYWYDTAPQGVQPARQRLRKDEITHLALEGGGGKGFAYLGAIRALEELGIVQQSKDSTGFQRLTGQIRGLAGASAGAITSMLLSCGLGSAEIETWMTKSVDFTKFFDPAIPRQDFQGTAISETPDEAKARKHWSSRSGWLELVCYGMADRRKIDADLAAIQPGAPYPPPKPPSSWDKDSTLTKIATTIWEIFCGVGPLPVQRLAVDLDARLAWLDRDMGMFSGAFAWSTFDALLRSRIPGRTSTDPVTFTEHHETFGVGLSLTGSNLFTGKTVYFSVETTPDLPVATAVRASMSLPGIFKPVRIRSQDDAIDGLYVDGGVWNNTPADAFDENLAQPTTLVLRLGIDDISAVSTFGEYLGRYLALTAAGSGETQFDRQRAFQAIMLDTTGLDTIDFTPPEKVRKAAADRAYAATREYFGSER